MDDADYENSVEELKKEAREHGIFVTRDSGKKAQHSDGVVRDTEEGKTKFTLMFPEGIPMDQQLITRVAELYTRGGEKYGDRNWENSKSADTLKHHTDALWRHFMNFFFDVQDGEDHAAAIVWNINAVELCRRNLKEAEVPDPFPEHLMAGEEIVKAPVPAWAKHSVKCCSEPVYSSLPFTLNDGCGKGELASEPLEKDPFKSYTFPYMGKDTAITGKYYQKEIKAGSYQEAQQLFDNWLAKQPFHPDHVPPVELEWSEGDILEEVGKPYTWVYEKCTDTWKYKTRDEKEPPPESARRSLRRLCAEFGPLRCTRGSNTGRIVDGT